MLRYHPSSPPLKGDSSLTKNSWKLDDLEALEASSLSGTFFGKKKHLQKISQLLLLADLPPLVSQDHPRYRNRSDQIHPPIGKVAME